MISRAATLTALWTKLQTFFTAPGVTGIDSRNLATTKHREIQQPYNLVSHERTKVERCSGRCLGAKINLFDPSNFLWVAGGIWDSDSKADEGFFSMWCTCFHCGRPGKEHHQSLCGGWGSLTCLGAETVLYCSTKMLELPTRSLSQGFVLTQTREAIHYRNSRGPRVAATRN